MKKNPIKLKSNSFTILVLYLFSNKMEKILSSLYEKMSKYSIFFQNTPLIVNISYLKKKIDLKKLKRKLFNIGILMVGVIGTTSNWIKIENKKEKIPIFLERKKNTDLFLDNINKKKLLL
ncbi:hypothetical protein RJT62_01380 [Buchnera aphidicola (Mindarus keteleerifoliae)]|uniref:hypothetical protein n=1 Tax=Buchnera aphidicola TaxID=9 RepID=UPI0031B72C3C